MVARALEERQSGHRARQRLTEELAEVQALMLLATEGRAGKPGQPVVLSRILEEPDQSYLAFAAPQRLSLSPVFAQSWEPARDT